MSSFTIRSVMPQDEAALADLAYRTYYKRFFCRETLGRDGKPYGGPLGQEFPELEKGQSRESFADYWRAFIPKMGNSDPKKRNYAFLAETEGGRIIGFAKGNGAPLDPALQDQIEEDPDRVAELGSLYIDFDFQQSMAGRLLTQIYARQMAKLGYRAMVARAYARNDSPFFMKKIGARDVGDCLHPRSLL